jgi:hypothetical protein
MSTSRKREAPSPLGAASAGAASQESTKEILQQASSGEQREAESLPDGGGAADQAKSRPGGGAADQEQSECSPPASLARRRLQIGAKKQIPKIKRVGPSTVSVSARKQR